VSPGVEWDQTRMQRKEFCWEENFIADEKNALQGKVKP